MFLLMRKLLLLLMLERLEDVEESGEFVRARSKTLQRAKPRTCTRIRLHVLAHARANERARGFCEQVLMVSFWLYL